ncbi:MAG: hypothetical protein IJF97_03110 [Eggerthellaceae bacterium]|nr:hypothetical protein [Eggerthellaceae bacterium]
MSRWESDPLIYAFDAEGSLVHVDSVDNGSACACVCPSCKQPLVAKNAGSVLIHHFAHQRGSCKWAAEAAVILVVESILREDGLMFVEGAGYMDLVEDCWFYYSPYGRLQIEDISVLDVGGRLAPALSISCVDEGGVHCVFALVVVLAQRLTEEQVEKLSDKYGNVLAIDFKSAYASARDYRGRHFSRSEFFPKAQDRSYLESILMGRKGSELLRWLAHSRRDTAEAEAYERFQNKHNEESRARMLELERMMDQIELKAELERVAEETRRVQEERRKAELHEQLVDAEKRAFEREGVEALPKTKHGVNFYVDECPLLGQADVVADCGGYAWSPNRCIFFEGQRRYFIGCTARQNGVGLDDE